MSDFDGQPTGPSRDTLKRLKDMMPQFMDAVEGKRRTRAAVAGKKARKLCSVCARLFDYVLTKEEITMGSGLCEICDKRLKDGYTALVCADKFAFVKSERLKDLVGQIVQVNPLVMAEVGREFQIQEQAKQEPEQQSGDEDKAHEPP